MNYICREVSECFWDEWRFYFALGLVCKDLTHRLSK